MASSVKPTILFVGQPIVFAHDAWAQFQQKFNILVYDIETRAEVIEAFAEGRKYSKIEGIVRPNLAPNMLPPLDEDLVSHLPPSLKIISYCNHGYDGQNIQALERKNIWYCNGAGGASDATADIGLFLILAVFRYTTFCEMTLREHQSADWFRVEDVCNTTQNPGGKILGIVGMGDIGMAIAQRARALGMYVHYYNRNRRPGTENSLDNATYHDNVDSLLKASDCVLLACPYTHQTHHLLNKTSLQLMKKGSRVVNISRGKVIDEAALVDALEEGHISSAGLDVFYDEPVVHPKLLENQKVTLLPHMAGGTIDSCKNFEEIAMKNIEEYFLGSGKPITPINNVSARAAT